MLAFALLVVSALAGVIVLLVFAARADRERWERGDDVDRRFDALFEERAARERERVPTIVRQGAPHGLYDDERYAEHNARAVGRMNIL